MTLLELRSYGVAFGTRVVLADVDLEVPPRGVLVLVGPGGAGKSTLLRTISGANDANPSLRVWGQAIFAGAPLGAGEMPALVAQKAKLLIGTVFENMLGSLPARAELTRPEQRGEAIRLLQAGGIEGAAALLDTRVIDLPTGLQRRIAVVRTAAAGPRLLCVDEPTAELPDADAEATIALLRAEGERRAVLFVTHNQRHARAAGGTAALLAGGRVHEHAPTEELFTAPLTRAAKAFARTGSCDVPSPGAAAETLAEGVVAAPIPAAAREAPREAAGPRGFRWLQRGALGGCPRPGIVDELEHDLDALRRVGVTVLITLETEHHHKDAVAAAGIRPLFFPIEDMRSPKVDAAIEHCREVERLVAAGEVVALHCRAGLGRTGTMLAAQLIYEGEPAIVAIERARRIEPRWIESADQVRFLERFAEARGAAKGTRAG
jgi:atypical dual specificity phosphatase